MSAVPCVVSVSRRLRNDKTSCSDETRKDRDNKNERQGEIYPCTTYQFIPGISCSHQEGPWDETSDGSTGHSNRGQTFAAKLASRHLRKELFEIPFDCDAKGCPHGLLSY